MAYKRVTREERSHIYRWCKEGHGLREIARRLGRAASTISREIERNRGKRGYRPKQAHEKAQQRGLRPGSRSFTDEMKVETESLLQKGWTPEIISQRARYEGRTYVCKETIYQHIYADANAGGALWKELPRARRKRRRRCPRTDAMC